MVFLNLRQRTDSVQALLLVEPEKVSKYMVKWAAGLADESIVRVEGVVKKSPEVIKSASVGDVEVHVTKVCRISIHPHSNLQWASSCTSSLGSMAVFPSLSKMLHVPQVFLIQPNSNSIASTSIPASITESSISARKQIRLYSYSSPPSGLYSAHISPLTTSSRSIHQSYKQRLQNPVRAYSKCHISKDPHISPSLLS